MTDTMTDELVLTTRRNGVLLMTLNRPDRLNAWNNALEDQYFDLLDEAENDPEVRAVVITGAGRGFCSGADLDDLRLAETFDPDAPLPTRRPRNYPMSLRKPLIAAINGAAVGLGLVEALYCDVRFASPSAKLITAFARRGLIAEYGISWLLPRVVGQSRTLDLLMSGRTVLGDEALRIGLVDYVVEPEQLVEAAMTYAVDLAANCSPTSMAIIKDQVRRDQESSLEDSIIRADSLMFESFVGADLKEGVASYSERRPPRFMPLAPGA